MSLRNSSSNTLSDMLNSSPLAGVMQKGQAVLQSISSGVSNLASTVGGKSAAEKKTAADQLILSNLSRQIELLNTEAGLGLDTEGAGADGEALSLDGLESLKRRGEMMSTVLQMKINNFQQKLTQSMQAAGIDAAQATKLQDGGEAGLLLAGDHPDAGKIRSLFQNDAALMDQFKEISNLAELVRGIDRLGMSASGVSANGAAAGGAHSPIAAYLQQRLGAEEGNKGTRFTLQVAANGAAYSFE